MIYKNLLLILITIFALQVNAQNSSDRKISTNTPAEADGVVQSGTVSGTDIILDRTIGADVTIDASSLEGTVQSVTAGTNATVTGTTADPVVNVPSAGIVTALDTELGNTAWQSGGTGTVTSVIEETNTSEGVTGKPIAPIRDLIYSGKYLANGTEFELTNSDQWTSWQAVNFSDGTSKGLNIHSTTGNSNFHNTGIIVDNNTYSITIEGICSTNNSSYFGFGLKNGSDWGGAVYRGTTGARSMLNYNANTFISGGQLPTTTGYSVGDTIKVQIIFRGSSSYMRTSVNGVWTIEAKHPIVNNPSFMGEIVISTQSVSVWDDVTLTIENNADFASEVYMSLTGDDENSGTSVNPIRSVAEGIIRTKGQGTIIVQEGDYLDEEFNLSGGIDIQAANGEKVRLIYGDRISTATLRDGYTKVYKTFYDNVTLTSSFEIWQHDIEDEASEILITERHPVQRGVSHRLTSTKCTWLNSLAELEAAATDRSYFYWAADTIYFTIVAGTNLTDNPIVIPDDQVVIGSGNNKKVKIKGIDFLYKSVNLEYTDFEVINSSVLFVGGSYGWQYGNTTGGIFRNCRAGGAHYNLGIGGDGFNGSSDAPTDPHALRTNVTLVECWAHDNADDGDSLHNYAENTIRGGLFEYNGSGITPASGGHTAVYNAIIRQNNVGLDVSGSPLDSGVNTGLVANSCLVIDNNTSVQGNNGTDRIITLINCVSVGDTFPITNIQKYGCVDE